MNYLNVKRFPSNKHFYLTKTNLDELKDQLNSLRKEKFSMCKRLLGMDTKDKIEYIFSTNAHNVLEKIDNEVANITDILLRSDVVEKNGAHSYIGIGSSVRLRSKKKVVNYTLVDSIEADPSASQISDESPLGKALIGKKEGSTIRVFTPKGEKLRYKVLSIS